MAAGLCVPKSKKGRPHPDKKVVENDSNECEESTGSHVQRRTDATRMAHGSKLTKAGMHMTLGLTALLPT